jgi:hypothetical protein
VLPVKVAVKPEADNGKGSAYANFYLLEHYLIYLTSHPIK